MDKPEDIKLLIICKIGLRQGTPQKSIVNVKTLSFRPPDGLRLQITKTGKPFRPENLCLLGETRGMCRGGKAAADDNSSVDFDDLKTDKIGDDQTVTEEKKVQ